MTSSWGKRLSVTTAACRQPGCRRCLEDTVFCSITVPQCAVTLTPSSSCNCPVSCRAAGRSVTALTHSSSP